MSNCHCGVDPHGSHVRSGAYNSLAYFTSMFIVEIPFLAIIAVLFSLVVYW